MGKEICYGITERMGIDIHSNEQGYSRERYLISKLHEKYKNMAKVGFGSQIRNYFLHPEQRVKDSRTGFAMGSFHEVLDGGVHPFMEEYLRWRVQTD